MNSTTVIVVLSSMKNVPVKCTEKQLKMLGDYWILAIVQSLGESEKRFTELQRELEHTSPTTLSTRLKRLEEQKIIKRKEETVDKLSVVYSLTKKGIGILPILKEIRVFSAKFINNT